MPSLSLYIKQFYNRLFRSQKTARDVFPPEDENKRLLRIGHFCGDRLKWALPIGGIVFVLYLLNVFAPIELYTQDLRFLLRGYALTDSNIVVVGITPSDIDEFGEPRWPRSKYARAIRNLNEAGAAVICMDIFFRRKGDKEEDQALVEATEKAGNVYYPVFCPVALDQYEEGPIRSVDQLRTNFDALTRAAAGVGQINLIPSAPDGKYRSVPLALQYRNRIYSPLGAKAAFAYQKKNVQKTVKGIQDLPMSRDGK